MSTFLAIVSDQNSTALETMADFYAPKSREHGARVSA